MPLITLVQNARSKSDNIVEMRLSPGDILGENLDGGFIQFKCSNDLKNIRACTSANIVYDASVPGSTSENIQINSIIY